MPDGERENAGVVAPQPLIYLAPLVLDLRLNMKLPIPFLPRGAARPRMAAPRWRSITPGLVLLHDATRRYPDRSPCTKGLSLL